MKAVLVLEEMPTECIECQFCRVLADNKPTETHCLLTAKRNEDGVNTRAEWCPLRPLPERKDEGSVLKPLPFEVYMYRYGFNECLDEIIGETE